MSFNKLTQYGLVFPGTVGGTGQTIADMRFVKVAATDGSADNQFLQAGANEVVLGVSSVPQGTEFPVVQTGYTPPTIPAVLANSGDRVDVFMDKAPAVELGGAVNAGDYVVSDADGRAIVATLAASNVAGIAMGSGVAGNSVPIFLRQSKINAT